MELRLRVFREELADTKPSSSLAPTATACSRADLERKKERKKGRGSFKLATIFFLGGREP